MSYTACTLSFVGYKDIKVGTVFLYKVYTRTPVNVAEYKCVSTKTAKTAVTAKKTVITGYEKKVTKEPVYEYPERDEWRYRELTNKATIDIKWSKSNKDETLLNQGYVLTGNTKTIQVSTTTTSN